MNGPNTSNSQTTITSKLSAKDIVSIIGACHNACVSEITIGELYISFHGAKSPVNLTDEAISPDNVVRSVPDEVSYLDTLDKDEELSMKLLSDPLAFEEMVEIE
jgi:hypothetical protein